MRITFKLFAQLQDFLPADARKTNACIVEIADATSVAQVIERFTLPPRLVHLVLLDGTFVPPAERDARILRDGETLAIWPPVAGG
ncbi:MAG: MoaD/ThiS family protein [Zoogloea sp.]|jgi:sulfur carrier protein ThiS|nr:MoaD/ThiS family protein [Zoogloea sp.]MCC7312694.1 MoaD/ThiS family protein [Sulfuritalea sp.]